MIPTLVIDSSNYISDLCLMGRIFHADKSPYNEHGHRHPYTPIYNMLMAQYRHKPVKFAEIGVAGSASVRMWNAYFEHGTFYFFDRDRGFLDGGIVAVGTEKNTFTLMDVEKPESIRKALNVTNGELDILLDDSSHNPKDQYHIIREGLEFVKSGGMIIIEDVERSQPNEVYQKIFEGIEDKFSFISFILTEHANKYSPGWDNDKLLVCVKK